MQMLDIGMPRKKGKKDNFGFDVPILDVSFPIDEEGEPPLPTKAQMKKMTKAKIEKAIKKKTKKKKHIIHGARAVNAQVSPKYRRKTEDYDLWAGKAALQADQLEDELDRIAGGDMFYERTLTMPDSLHDGEKKIHQVVNRKTQDSVADYSRRPPGAQFVNINDLRFESLAHAKKTKVAILRMAEDCSPLSLSGCPITVERERKTRRDLKRILRYEKSKKK
jgi:hypothetical protein